MFDCIEETQEELIEHVKAACEALDYLRSHELDDVLESGQLHEAWGRHWNALNRARVHLAMAAESLHEELNYHNDRLIEAQREEMPSSKGKRKRSPKGNA